MDTIRFTETDAYLLWCLDRHARLLATWIRGYTLLTRDAAPNYVEVTQCLDRAVQAGALSYPQSTEFALNPEWLNKLPPDARALLERNFLGMAEFSEWLPTVEWPIVEYRRYCLLYDVYMNAVGTLPQRPMKP